jgi:hypothetical protein
MTEGQSADERRAMTDPIELARARQQKPPSPTPAQPPPARKSPLRWGWVIFLAVGVIGYAITQSGGGSSSPTVPDAVKQGLNNLAPLASPANQAGSFPHCQKATGALLFRLKDRPFTPAYRQAVDEACHAAKPNSLVPAVAQEADAIARGGG